MYLLKIRVGIVLDRRSSVVGQIMLLTKILLYGIRGIKLLLKMSTKMVHTLLSLNLGRTTIGLLRAFEKCGLPQKLRKR